VIVVETVVPTLIATVIATGLTRLVVGEGPLYGQRAFVLSDVRELIAFAALGAVCALVAWGFTRLVSITARGFRMLPPPWRQAAGGLGAGAIVAALPLVAGNGYEP